MLENGERAIEALRKIGLPEKNADLNFDSKTVFALL
jgi:hypothetical protein